MVKANAPEFRRDVIGGARGGEGPVSQKLRVTRSEVADRLGIHTRDVGKSPVTRDTLNSTRTGESVATTEASPMP